MSTELNLIRTAPTIEEASIIVGWLQRRGVDAMIADRLNAGALAFGLTDDEGFAICAQTEAAAEEGKALLSKHDEEVKRATDSEPVTVTCPECNEESTFPGHDRGTVQNCIHCRAHVDVPEA